MDEASERAAYMAQYGKVWSVASLEKVLLIGLLSVIFGSVLPGLKITSLMLFTWTGVFVLINAAIGLWVVRRHWSTDSVLLSFVTQLVINSTLVIVVDVFWYESIDRTAGLFFVMLFSVLVTLYDRYRPVHEYRAHSESAVTT